MRREPADGAADRPYAASAYGQPPPYGRDAASARDAPQPAREPGRDPAGPRPTYPVRPPPARPRDDDDELDVPDFLK
jgi:hypothetical protein